MEIYFGVKRSKVEVIRHKNISRMCLRFEFIYLCVLIVKLLY